MLKALQDKFADAMTKAEAIRLKYEGKSETMTAQEETEWTRLLDEADKVKKQIETHERQDALKAFADRTGNALPQGGGGGPVDDKGAPVAPGTETKALQKQVVEKVYSQGNRKGLSTEEQTVLTELEKKAFRTFLTGGLKGMTRDELIVMKAYQADSPASGGFLISPQTFVMELITLMKDLVFMRGLATNYTVDRAEGLGIPSLDVDPADADWTSELATGNEDQNMVFGKRELKPSPLAKRVKLSNKLLRQSAMDPEGIVRDRLSYKFGVSEEKAFLQGSGADQPLGVFTASTNGISTARDITAASATAVAADDLINVKYGLKAQYMAKAVWILHRDTIKAVRKLKDANQNYIWASGLGPGGGFQGTPETILDRPYYMSEYAPNTFTTGQYIAIFGDFSRYVIATALDMQIQVLDQLYAETNQTGYIGRLEVDGMPTLEEAFSRLKLA